MDPRWDKYISWSTKIGPRGVVWTRREEVRLFKGRVEASVVREPTTNVPSAIVAGYPISSRPTPAVMETPTVGHSVAARAIMVL